MKTELIDESAVLEAESAYSQGRLKALTYEWFTDYPGLETWFKIFKKRQRSILLSDINPDTLLEMCFKYIDKHPMPEHESTDKILELAMGVKDNSLSIDEFRKEIIYIFYEINLIGLSNSGIGKISWYDLNSSILSLDDLEDDTILTVHKCFSNALKVTD